MTEFLKKNKGKIIIYTIIIIIIIIYVILPLYELVITSFKYKIDTYMVPKIFLPDRFTLDNYLHVFGMDDIGLYFSNSIIVATSATIICLIVGFLAAYVLVRVKLPFNLSYSLTYWILLARMYPTIATIVPYFLLMKNLGLLDTRIALIITDTSFNLPFVIWLLMGLLKELPTELEEAARIDGCSTWQVITRITLPLVTPGLISTGTLTFIFTWNDFIFPLFLSSRYAKTLAVVLPGFLTDRDLLWGPMTALSTLMIIPVLILALIFQRYLVRGLTMGAIK